ncbi:MAG: hypothetical protein ACM3NQ_01340, partial [Bacteroidales bacterium]
RLMGLHIDALKLVSSLTLFQQVAETLQATTQGEAADDMRDIARLARDVLAVANAQGYPRCGFTARETARDNPSQ